MFIDTHAHLYCEEFENDSREVIRRACEAGADKLFLPCINEDSIVPMQDLCTRYPNLCYPMLGLHPTEMPKNPYPALSKMEELLKTPNNYIAIGEVGLDFYWDDSRKKEQIRVLQIQTEWALRYNLPLMIHSRSSHHALVDTLRPYAEKGIRGVFHCFSGTAEEAEELLSKFSLFKLGIGGVVTFKKSALPSILANVPLNRIVMETDSPYLAPTPYRGKRNESSYTPLIAQKLGEIYGLPISSIYESTSQNALEVFPRAQ